MLYVDFKVKDKELRLRLDARACVSLERKLGKSPLDVLIEVQENKIPKLENMITILHAALQKYQNGYTEEKVYDLYDEYIEEGNSMLDLLNVLLDVFKVSGFFKEEEVKN